MTREYTNKILELIDEGMIDKDWLIPQLLVWMSEHDVKEFYEANFEEEDDPMDDFNYVGSRHHY